MTDMNTGIHKIRRSDLRYDRSAYYFVFHALDFTLKRQGRRGHITGQTLLDGIREYALKQFGFLAKTVFNSWGVQSTEDFGEIVFNLVEQDLMKTLPTDTKDDFAGGYDFEVAFEREFSLSADELDISRN